MRPDLLAAEQRCAEALESAGVMMSSPGEGHPESDLFNSWGVCVGSHGGYDERLIVAMRKCLKCCGIGKWWGIDGYGTELLRDVFDRLAKEHLGTTM
jgi:hypothetical protein